MRWTTRVTRWVTGASLLVAAMVVGAVALEEKESAPISAVSVEQAVTDRLVAHGAIVQRETLHVTTEARLHHAGRFVTAVEVSLTEQTEHPRRVASLLQAALTRKGWIQVGAQAYDDFVEAPMGSASKGFENAPLAPLPVAHIAWHEVGRRRMELVVTLDEEVLRTAVDVMSVDQILPDVR